MPELLFYDITLEDFKPFRGRHVFAFDNAAGLYYLTGRNEREPRLGANGAGKTSVWDGLRWCLYGATTRGLRAGNIRNWAATGPAAVTVRFHAHDEDFVLSRTWQPNSLTLDGELVEQTRVDNLIGFGARAFDHTVVNAQFGRMFFDLKPAEKIELLAEVMSLDYWDARAEDAKKHATRAAAVVEECRVEDAGLRARAEEQEAAAADADSEAAAFKEARAARVAARRAELRAARDVRRARAEELDKAEQHARRARDEMARRGKFRPVDTTTYDKQIDAVNRHRAEYLARAETAQLQIERLTNVQGAQCPVCQQRVTKKHARVELERIGAVWEESTDGVVECDRELAELGRARADAQAKNERRRNRYEEARAAYDSAEAACQRCEARLDAAKRDVAAALAAVKAARTEQNTAERRARRHRREAAAREAERAETAQRQEAAEIEQAAYDFWRRRFRDVRLFIVDEALTALEVEVNNNVEELGLEGWAVRFDVEREKATGGTAKGFHVMIESPDSDAEVPWEAWSGGETQRLRIAGALGLANLVMNARGVYPNIEVYDEPTHNLNDIDDVLTAFAARAAAHGRQLWLTCHRSVDWGGFAGVVNIVKGTGGSYIEGASEPPRAKRERKRL